MLLLPFGVGVLGFPRPRWRGGFRRRPLPQVRRHGHGAPLDQPERVFAPPLEPFGRWESPRAPLYSARGESAHESAASRRRAKGHG